jgi:hypothetical protein
MSQRERARPGPVGEISAKRQIDTAALVYEAFNLLRAPEYKDCPSSFPIQVANGSPREQCYATLRMIVIGRYPYYLVLAESLKARAFNVPQDPMVSHECGTTMGNQSGIS